MEEEESVFEENPKPIYEVGGQSHRLFSDNPDDSIIEINIDGHDLESVRSQIMNLAPMMGFQIEKAEIVHKSSGDRLDELNQSNVDSFRSYMSNDMRDEIKRMVQEQVKEELKRSTASLNTSTLPSESEAN